MAPSLDDLVEGIRRIPVDAVRTWEDIQGKWQAAIRDVRTNHRFGNFIGSINGKGNGHGNSIENGNGNGIGIGNGNGNGLGISYGNVIGSGNGNGNGDEHGNAMKIEIRTGSSESGTENQKKSKKKIGSSGKGKKGKSPQKERGKGRVSSVEEASGREGSEASFLESEEGERGGRGEGGVREVDGEERGEQFRVSNGANSSVDWEEIRTKQERKGFSMGPPFVGMEVDRYEGDEWMVGGEEEREREDNLDMTPLPREVDENDSWDQSQLAMALQKQPILNEGPVDRQQLGRATWTFLHTLAAQYPENPTRQQQKDVKELMHIMTRIYPCSVCAEHFKEVIRDNPPVCSSNHELSQWMCRVHNVVNRSLDKPLFPCERVDSRWGQLECDQNACTMEGKK